MPDQEAISDARTQIALVERVVRAETKIDGLKEDASIIRNAIHGIHGEMQKFVAEETKCASALSAIAQTLTDWKPKIEALSFDQSKREGVRLTYATIGVFLVGIVGIAVGASSVVISLFHK